MSHLNIQQISAVKKALTEPASIVLGPPGSGKTKLIQAIVQAWRFENTGCTIYLLSPTGKASKVIQRLDFPMIRVDEEKLSREYPSVLDKQLPSAVFSATIDLFLERYKKRIRKEPVRVIVDEVSMCDSLKLYKTFELLNFPDSIVLIGDPSQLSCVTQSSVELPLLTSLLQARAITTLTQVYRYDVNSALGLNVAARKIVSQDDYTFKLIEVSSYVELKDYVLRANLSNPQFICVYNKQRETLLRLFPKKKKQRIICRCNYYDDDSGVLQIANGDIGRMASRGRVQFNGIKYDPKYVEFERADVITIHLAQGDEYDNVVLVAPSTITQRLFYTAISRAKKKCLVLCVGKLEITPDLVDDRINPFL